MERVVAKIGELGSKDHIVELETRGYTTLERVLSDEHVDRHAGDERFQVLLGSKQPYGWQLEGPDHEVMARNPRGLFD